MPLVKGFVFQIFFKNITGFLKFSIKYSFISYYQIHVTTHTWKA